MSIFNHDEFRTIWYLSTIGNNKNYKKINKVNILNVSIPRTVELIDNSINLRLSSNLLYGLSILYKLKVNLFYNDLSFIKSQFKSTSILKTSNNLLLPNKTRNNLNTFLRDDGSFIIDDLIPRFMIDDIEIGRNFELIPELNQDYTLNQINDLNRSIDDFDINFDLDLNFDQRSIGRSSVHSNIPSDIKFENEFENTVNAGHGSMAVGNNSANNNGDTRSTSGNIEVRKYKKRKFALIIDDEINIPLNVYNEFRNNYDLIMEVKKFSQSLNFDNQIEHGRRLTQDIMHQSDDYDLMFDDEHEQQQRHQQLTEEGEDEQFDISFPEVDISSMRSRSRSNSITVTNSNSTVNFGQISGLETEKIEKTNKFLRYLQNFERSKVSFSDICPNRCFKKLVCKSFISILELSTNSLIELDIKKNQECELMKSTDFDICLID